MAQLWSKVTRRWIRALGATIVALVAAMLISSAAPAHDPNAETTSPVIKSTEALGISAASAHRGSQAHNKRHRKKKRRSLTSPTPAPTGPALTIDASADRHPISPDVYGMNFAEEDLAGELRLTVRRWGGNATTRYNWQHDTANHASDWYFENIPKDNPDPGALPNGSESDRFVEQDQRTGTRTLLTIPLIGWTPKDRSYACGFSVSKYGAQQQTDPCAPVRSY